MHSLAHPPPPQNHNKHWIETFLQKNSATNPAVTDDKATCCWKVPFTPKYPYDHIAVANGATAVFSPRKSRENAWMDGPNSSVRSEMKADYFPNDSAAQDGANDMHKPMEYQVTFP